jgi:protease-4
MVQGMRTLATVLGTLLFFLPARLLRLLLDGRRRRRRAVVTLRLSGQLSEGSGGRPRFGGARPGGTTLGVLRALEAASEDPSVEGVAVTIGRVTGGWGQLEEIRDGVLAVSKAGRQTFVYLEQPSHIEWFLASAFDHVSMPPMATLDIVGLRAEVRFFKGLLDKLGVRSQLATRGEYKSVVEPFSRESMSPAFRESLDGVLRGIHGRFLAALGARLDLDTAAAQAVVDAGPFSADEALERRLVDAVVYPDRWRRLLKNRLGRGMGVSEPTDRTAEADAAFLDTPDVSSRSTGPRRLRLVSARRFLRPWRLLRRLERWASPSPRVAVVVAEGEIVDSAAAQLPPGKIGSRPYGALFDALRRDDSIGAVVLRIDSPGGSAGASDMLWRDLRRLAAKKPVIASMGSVAASGGYYMAVAAHHIVADATTITGSIGVAAGKFEVSGLLEKLGVTEEVISYGANSGMNSLAQGFSESESERLSVQLDRFYDGFVSRAAAGRRMEFDELEAHARGRIWTGSQAVELGLVDSVGGIQAAISVAGKRAGLGARPDLVLVEPARPGLLDRIQRIRPPMLRSLADLPKVLGIPTGLQARLPADIAIK